MLLGQALESRTDLTALRETDADLADRFSHVCGRLDATEAAEGSVNKDASDERRRLAEEFASLVNHIRTLPGLDRFLLPADVSRLTAEAYAGPIVLVNVSRYRCDALILTPEDIQKCELPALSLADVRTRLTELRSAVSGTSRPAKTRQETERILHDTLAWLWDNVTGPILDRLGIAAPLQNGQDWPRLWWVPCGPLAHFPLHAAGRHLEDAKQGHSPTVLDRVASSYSPTVRALTHAREQYARRTARRTSRRPRTLVVAMPHTPDAADLPGTQRELAQITRLLPAAETLIGQHATRDTVLSRLPDATWVHFACHAIDDPTDPANSRLLIHDHTHNPLSVQQISRLRLDEAEFAYLSACNTAVTTPELADESIHIVSAFQQAGYPHVVGTLWEIDDAVAAELTEIIYMELASNASDVGVCTNRATRLVRDRYPRVPTLWASHIHAGP